MKEPFIYLYGKVSQYMLSKNKNKQYGGVEKSIYWAKICVKKKERTPPSQ